MRRPCYFQDRKEDKENIVYVNKNRSVSRYVKISID